MSVDTELKEAKLVVQRIFYDEFCGINIVVDSYDNNDVQRLLAVCVEANSFFFSVVQSTPKIAGVEKKEESSLPYS